MIVSISSDVPPAGNNCCGSPSRLRLSRSGNKHRTLVGDESSYAIHAIRPTTIPDLTHPRINACWCIGMSAADGRWCRCWTDVDYSSVVLNLLPSLAYSSWAQAGRC
jgi:hypothetical protein